MVLDWDGKHYSALSRMPLASVISPQFVRIRDDKEANVEDVNIRQISDLVPVADVEKPAREIAARRASCSNGRFIQRRCRAAQMVRKLLLWKTNKEERGEFPGYVVYLTDFSPNRQNPLERDIKISNSEADRTQACSTICREKNFVGGWEKVA